MSSFINKELKKLIIYNKYKKYNHFNNQISSIESFDVH